MRFEIVLHAGAQRAGALAVDDVELRSPGSDAVVDERVDLEDRVVHQESAQVQLVLHRLDVLHDLSRLRDNALNGRLLLDGPQVAERHIDLDMPRLNLYHTLLILRLQHRRFAV